MKAPENLLEAIRYFTDEDVSLTFVANIRWPDGPKCPRCDTDKEPGFLKTRRVWKCKGCKKQFSVKVGTIFEDSPLGLSKWLPAMWMLANCKNGISSYELARDLGITQKSAWFMLHRIRLAMQAGGIDKLSGDVEVDETFIGGKARNMHKDRKERVIKGTGGMGKVAVMGLLERHDEGTSKVVTTVVNERLRKKAMQSRVKKHVEEGTNLYTDAFKSYSGLDADYVHQVIDHAEAYARGAVHTNGLENFWSLVKRSLLGTYVSVESFHLFRYLTEQAWRFNARESTDSGRFLRVLSSILDKRLTYNELTGREPTWQTA